MKLEDLNEGDIITLDDGFTCNDADPAEVKKDEYGLYIDCDEGKHYLDGQEDENGELIGISLTKIST